MQRESQITGTSFDFIDAMLGEEDFAIAFTANVMKLHGKSLESASNREKYLALADLVRTFLSRRLADTEAAYRQEQKKQVYYLSLEFLPGRLLAANLLNLGLQQVCEQGLRRLNINLAELIDQEEDPALGNGGLGRLAACYLDSMASLGLAGHGCGIRYRYGLFEQRVIDGYQREFPDNWLKEGRNEWEYRRPEETMNVRFGGQVRTIANGKLHFIHENYQQISAVPYDIPIAGYQNEIVNTLRLWSAEVDVTYQACTFDRHGKGCINVIADKHVTESLTDTLYPDDSLYEGKLLRLKQQYFLVSASLQSILRKHVVNKTDLRLLPEKLSIHINDTHPSLAVAELMRLLLDEYGLGWAESWDITTRTISYTNHTVLPEALEKWPIDLFQTLLPRIYMIVQEINERFCRELWDMYPGDWQKIKAMAIIADGNVHMAALAIAGSHHVNGVSAIHTQILKQKTMSDFYQFMPQKFLNITNGVTHRRWMLLANPDLAQLICEAIGDRWIANPDELQHLLNFAHDNSFCCAMAKVKFANKLRLAKYIQAKHGIAIDTCSLIDSHIKRIHAYKRQSMNVLHIMDLYNRILDNPHADIVPRTFIFAGKAAPGYYKAKQTIKLIHALAEKINHDPLVKNRIKVVFLQNYNVSHAELIIPGSDVSEQIPTASMEACGTGNMKFMMNGAVTIGTLDGANIAIWEAVGDDNIFTFGLTADQVLAYYRNGGYNPWDIYHQDLRVKTVMEQLVNGFFPYPEEFRVHYDAFLNQGDHYFVLKDFAKYVEAQNKLANEFINTELWQKKCIANVAHSGIFAGDRAFAEYALSVWDLAERPPCLKAH